MKKDVNIKCKRTFWYYVLYVASRLFPTAKCPKWLSGKVSVYVFDGDKLISKVTI